jgi:S-formylglutathione hydrolase
MATQTSSNKSFGGFHRRFTHASAELGCAMTFSVYFPPAASSAKVPVVYFLSGLTCSDENFSHKAGAQRVAAELGVGLVMPDTSPRGLGVAGEADAWDFGVGAGFYVDATTEAWRAWRMYSYCRDELPALLKADAQFASLDTERASVMGHSMGGHGALVLALRNPGRYRSVSAFAPICNPCDCPWGEKAFSGYLGPDREVWKAYDACELLRGYTGPHIPTLVDCGTADAFLATQLKPERLAAAAEAAGFPLQLRMQEGYDHSYYFIATFVEDHLRHHAAALNAA